jgi:hypothetical protein
VDFQLKINPPEATKKISFGDKIIFLGSCFSDEMSVLAKQHGFHVISNPFGTLFHPNVIAQNILFSLREEWAFNIVRNHDVYLDYSCSGRVYGMSEVELKQKVLFLRNELKNELRSASHLFVTFGTAFAYHLNETNQLVGNCHKQNAQLFSKKLTEIESITSLWNEVINEIKLFNPEIQIYFTISPVRHIKDGLHENNLSKSTLFLAIKKFHIENSTSYFPAFELVNDVLRDYRFFKEDMVHPNQQAVQFVWAKFMNTFLSNEIIELAKKVNEIKLAMNHRLQYPESKMAISHRDILFERKRKMENENLHIYWDK